MTIRTKITLLSAVSLTVALGVTATTSVVFLSQNARAQAVRNATGGLNQADASISLFLENQYQLLHSLASDPGLWAGAGTWRSYQGTTVATKLDTAEGPPAERLVGGRFATVLQSFDHVSQIEAGTNDGHYLMVPKGTKPAGYRPDQRPWYAAAQGKPGMTSVRRTTEGNLVVSLAEPFSSGGVQGVVSLSLGLGDLNRITDAIRIGDNGFVMLFQTDGTIITGGKVGSLEGKTTKDPEASALAPLGLGEASTTKLPWQGKVWDVLTQPSHVEGWVVAAFLDTDEYESQARTFLVILGGLTVLVLVVTLVFSTWIAARISAPLKTVANGIRQIAEGEADLTVTLPVKGNDEVTALTIHFNAFLGHLDALVGNLKTKATQLLGSYASLSEALTENGASVHEITQSAKVSAERLEKERGMVDQATQRVHGLTEGLERILGGVESTRSSVQQASSSIEEMAGNIQATAGVGERGGTTAVDLLTRVSAVSELSAQIAAAMAEQSQANRELLESVSEMRQRSDAIGKLASEEVEGARAIRDFLSGLTKLSQEISASKDEEALGLEEINRATANITTVAADLKSVADDIQAEFSRFVTSGL